MRYVRLWPTPATRLVIGSGAGDDPNRTFGHVVRRLRLIALKYIPELTTASDWPDSMLRETAK